MSHDTICPTHDLNDLFTFNRPIICQNIVKREMFNKMTRTEMKKFILEKHGIIFHRLSDTCITYSDGCNCKRNHFS